MRDKPRISVGVRRRILTLGELKPGQFFRFVGHEQVCIMMSVGDSEATYRLLPTNTPQTFELQAGVVRLRMASAHFEEV